MHNMPTYLKSMCYPQLINIIDLEVAKYIGTVWIYQGLGFIEDVQKILEHVYHVNLTAQYETSIKKFDNAIYLLSVLMMMQINLVFFLYLPLCLPVTIMGS